MEKIRIQQTGGSGHINDLIKWLEIFKQQGANNYAIEFDKDPHIGGAYLKLYRVLTREEIKQNRIKELEEELRKLKQ